MLVTLKLQTSWVLKMAIVFSVFTIDTVNSKIYETKVGRGNDREFDFVPAEAIVAQWNK